MTAAVTPPTRSPATHRVRAPETATMVTTMVHMMRTVPVSFCSSTRPMGIAARPSARATSRSRGSASASRFSDRITARMRTIATLANSDGWRVKPPGTCTQARAPAMVVPSGV